MLLTGLRIDQLGHPDARFNDFALDFTDDDGPADSVVWLDNGGGKTTVTSLVFNVLRPDRRRDFVARLRDSNYRLEHYVGGRDSGHVILRWQVRTPDGTDVTLLTGMVHEWDGRQRSNDPSKLKSHMWGYRVIDGMPDLDQVRLTDADSRQLTRVDFLAQVRASAVAGADVVVTDNQLEWTRWLDAHHVDQELLRLQIRMNGEEGGASRLFSYASVWDFTTKTVDLLSDPDELGRLRKLVERVRDKHEQAAADRRDQALCAATLEPLRAVAGGTVELSAARDQAVRRIADATGLLQAASNRAQTERRCAADARKAATQDSTLASQLEGEADDDRGRAARARWLAATFDLHVATAQAKQVKQERDDAAAAAAAWETVPLALQLRELDAELDTRRTLLAEADEQATAAAQVVEQVARQLGGRLGHQRQVLLDRAAELKERADTAEEEMGQLEEQRGKLRDEQSQWRRRVEAARDAANDLQREVAALVDDGVLVDGEDPSDGVARIERELEHVAEQRADAEVALDDATRDVDRLTGEVEDLTYRLPELKVQRNVAAEKVDNLQQRRRWLLDRPQVQLAGPDDTLADAADVLAHVDGQVDDVRTAHDRARDAARTTEARLLRLDEDDIEVADDVRAAVDALVAAGIPAAAGWRWVASAPVDRAATVAADPAAVEGVVLLADHAPADAAAVLEQLDLPARPLTVTARDTVGTAQPEGRVTRLPAAHRYDRDAAARLRQELTDRLKEQQEQLRAADRALEDVTEVRDRLEAFESDGGAALTQLVADRDDLHAQVERDAARLTQAREELTHARAAHEQAATSIATLDVQKATLRGHVGRAGSAVQVQQRAKLRAAEAAGATEEIARLEGELEAAATRRTELRDDVATLRRDAAEVQADAKQVAARARRFDVELVDGADITGLPDVDTLDRQLRDARVRLQEVTPDEELQREVDELSRERGAVNEQLDALDGPVVQAAQELADTAEARDVTSRTRRLERARKTVGKLDRKVGAADATLERARREERQARPDDPDALPELDPAPADADEALAAARTAAAAAAAADDEAQRLRAAARERTDDAVRHDVAAKRLDEVGESVSTACERVRQRRAVRDAVVPAADVPPSTGTVDVAVKALQHRVRQLDGAGVALDDADGALAEQRVALATALDEHTDADEVVRLRLRDVATSSTVDVDELRQLVDDVAVRDKHLTDKLAELRRDVAEAAQSLMWAARDAVADLRALQRASQVPDSIPQWAGRPFITVTFGGGTDDEDLQLAARTVLGRVLDGDGQVPATVELVIDVVRQCVGRDQLRVGLLKPTDTMGTERQPVEAFAASDGQKLTAAILLYCSLAQLRARKRGRAGQGAAGLLWLDNPFGKASRMDLVNLQRQVADAMGIQLAYLTGVKDVDAIEQFTRRTGVTKRLHRRDGSGQLRVSHDPSPVTWWRA